MTDENDKNTPDEQRGDEENVNPEASGDEVGGETPEASADGESAESAPVEGASEADAPAGDAADAILSDDEKVVNDGDESEGDAEAAMMAMLEDLPQEDAGASPDDIDFGATSVSQAEFQQLSEPARGQEARNIDILMDVNLPVSIELGRTKMTIADILALGPGSVVELNKLAGEPVDLMVNYKIVARGEVVVVDENFGVRITQLMTPEERLKALGDA